METLSIVAYRQPLTRSEVESIRGVDCGGTLKYLFEKGLVRIIGRKEEPGRPIIYATSKEFLELFSLKALSDLPALHEFHELWDEHQEIVDDQTPLDEKAESEEEEVHSKEEDAPLVSEQGEAAENRTPPEKPNLSDHE
jgi:segregation and condensation protein B